MSVGIECRIGRDERQIVLISELDKAGFRPLFVLVLATRNLDVEPPGKKRDEALQDEVRGRLLSLADQPHEGAVSTGRQGYQAVGPALQRVQADMCRLLHRAAEMGGG